MTISLLPRIFATLPSTAMSLAPSSRSNVPGDYIPHSGPGRRPVESPPCRSGRTTSGGLAKTLKSARELGCETVQIFVSNPQGWADPMPRGDADVLVAGASEIGVSPVVAHAKYLINLASKDEELRDRSVQALAHEMAAAGALGVDLVVVHAGSHGGDGVKKGTERLVEGLGRARERAADL